jgi:hypothetical protein
MSHPPTDGPSKGQSVIIGPEWRLIPNRGCFLSFGSMGADLWLWLAPSVFVVQLPIVARGVLSVRLSALRQGRHSLLSIGGTSRMFAGQSDLAILKRTP